MCSGRWRSRQDQFFNAIKMHNPIDQVVVGDPTSFRNASRDGFDRGWDLESKQDPLLTALVEYQLEATMNEYDQEWKNKEVENPKTGNKVKVGSLPPDEQEKYRPDKEKAAGDEPADQHYQGPESEPSKDEFKRVPGGIVVNKPMTPQDFKDRTANMTPASSMVSKKWNSKFDVMRDTKGVYHLFHSTFDRGEVDGGAMNPERANTVKHVGAFTSSDAAKKYVMGGDNKWDLDQKKRVTIAKQTPWTSKEMGI